MAQVKSGMGTGEIRCQRLCCVLDRLRRRSFIRRSGNRKCAVFNEILLLISQALFIFRPGNHPGIKDIAEQCSSDLDSVNTSANSPVITATQSLDSACSLICLLAWLQSGTRGVEARDKARGFKITRSRPPAIARSELLTTSRHYLVAIQAFVS